MTLYQGEQIFQNNLQTTSKRLHVTRVTCSKSRTECPQISAANVQNSFPCRPTAQDLRTSALYVVIWNGAMIHNEVEKDGELIYRGLINDYVANVATHN
jgi:hypothetical protein